MIVIFSSKEILFLLIFAVVIVLTIFVCIKAARVSRIRRERLKKEAAIWKRDYDLRQNFSVTLVFWEISDALVRLFEFTRQSTILTA